MTTMATMDLASQIKNCTACPLRQNVKCPLPGEGPLTADVMLIGEAPGRYESYLQKNFSGPAGQILNKLLSDAGFSRDDLYVTGVVKCWPKAGTCDQGGKENRAPKAAEIKVCTAHLLAEIDQIKPKLIIAAGNVPLKFLMGRTHSVTSARGSVSFVPKFNAHVLSIFHPAALLHHPEHYGVTVDDLKRGKAYTEGTYVPEKKIPTNYILADTLDKAKAIIGHLFQSPAFAYDIETTGFDFFNDKFLCIGFSWAEGEAGCIPFIRHDGSEVFSSIERKEIYALLRTILADSTKVKVAQNGKFDNKFLITQGLPVSAPLFDTMLAHHLLDENAQGMHGLKALAWQYTDMGGYERALDEHMRLNKMGKDFASVPTEVLAKYNCADADCTLRLYQPFKDALVKEGLEKLFTTITMPLAYSLMHMEYTGIAVDVPYLKTLDTRYAAQLTLAKALLHKSVGYEVNLNSPKQLQKLLFEELKLKPIGFTASGAPSTDVNALKVFAEKHEIPKLLLGYRKAEKIHGTYIVGLKKLLDKDGAVHTSFLIHGTQTGRLSSRGPNLQNIPANDEIRSLFTARPGRVLIQADYASAEFKAWAHYAKDAIMISDIVNGIDIHRKVASQVYGIQLEDVTKVQRKQAKLVVFGLMYGRGAPSVAKQFGFTVAEANKIIDTFFKMYPAASRWLTTTELEAKRFGVLRNFFGRKRRLPGVYSTVSKIKAEALRQSRNFPIQSLVADLTNFAIVRLHAKLKDDSDSNILVQVHDAIIVETTPEKVDIIAPMLQETMETHIKGLRVPFVVDLQVGKTWGSLKSYSNIKGIQKDGTTTNIKA